MCTRTLSRLRTRTLSWMSTHTLSLSLPCFLELRFSLTGDARRIRHSQPMESPKSCRCCCCCFRHDLPFPGMQRWLFFPSFPRSLKRNQLFAAKERKKERRDEKIWKKFETNVTSAAAERGFGFRLVRGQRLAAVLKERCLDSSMH